MADVEAWLRLAFLAVIPQVPTAAALVGARRVSPQARRRLALMVAPLVAALAGGALAAIALCPNTQTPAQVARTCGMEPFARLAGLLLPFGAAAAHGMAAFVVGGIAILGGDCAQDVEP